MGLNCTNCSVVWKSKRAIISTEHSIHPVQEPAFISVSTSGTDGAAAGVLQCFLNMQRDRTLQLDSTQAKAHKPAAENTQGISPES